MIKVTKKKRKNPDSQDTIKFIRENSINFHKIGQGGEGIVFYFKLNKSLVVDVEILKPGEYTFKLFRNNSGERPLRRSKILKIYSKYGLIPKIYLINNNYSISDYIHGHSLNYVYEHFPKSIPNINYKLDKLRKIWYKLGFEHGDMTSDNILISENLKSVYLIDPYIEYNSPTLD